MGESFLLGKDGPVTTITFNRPEHRNSMNREIMAELEKLLLHVRDDREMRVLIVTGEGPAFSAGAEIPGAKSLGEEERRQVFARNKGLPRLVGRVFDLIVRLDALTIASVNGYAVGGGWALALAFDFVIAAEEAEFWVPEVDLGVPFTGAPALVMAARMGPWRAKEAAIICRRYKAAELFAIGMVNRVVKSEELRTATDALAQELLKKPYKAASKTKHLIDEVFVGPRLF